MLILITFLLFIQFYYIYQSTIELLKIISEIQFKLTIHNIPYFIFALLFCVGGLLLTFHNPFLYLGIGIVPGVLMFFTMFSPHTQEVLPNFTLSIKIWTIILNCLAWAPSIVMMIFAGINLDKINNLLKK